MSQFVNSGGKGVGKSLTSYILISIAYVTLEVRGNDEMCHLATKG